MPVFSRRLTAASLALAGASLFALQPLANAQDDAPRQSRVPPAEVTGEPVSCINLFQIRNSEVRDDKTIDFMMRGGKVYRNELPYQCSTLGFDRAFSYATSQAQLCNVDIITVVRNIGGRLDSGGSCGLGMFTPVELIKQPKAK